MSLFIPMDTKTGHTGDETEVQGGILCLSSFQWTQRQAIQVMGQKYKVGFYVSLHSTLVSLSHETEEASSDSDKDHIDNTRRLQVMPTYSFTACHLQEKDDREMENNKYIRSIKRRNSCRGPLKFGTSCFG